MKKTYADKDLDQESPTDYATLVCMFSRAGINFSITKQYNKYLIIVNKGHRGFLTKLEFNTEGDLVAMGAYDGSLE